MNTTPHRVSMTTATVVTGSEPAIPAVAVTDGSRVATGVINGGTFDWGINAIFLGCPASPMAGGRVTGAGGADFVDGEFLFPVNAENSTIGSRGNAAIVPDGGADLKAYEGLGPDGGWSLDLLYDDLVPEIAGASATLTGDHELSGARGGGTEPTVSETGDGVPLTTFTPAEPPDPATGGFSTTEVGTSAAQRVADSLGRYDVGTGMAPAGLDLSFTGRHGPAPTPTAGSSSGGPGLVALSAVPGGIPTPVAAAPGALSGPQLLS